jgi:hypothetical protein
MPGPPGRANGGPTPPPEPSGAVKNRTLGADGVEVGAILSAIRSGSTEPRPARRCVGCFVRGAEPGRRGRTCWVRVGAPARARRRPGGLRRAARPARWPMGTPTRPACGAPGGTRSASGSAAGAPRDGWGDRSHTGRCQTRRTVGSDGNSSFRSLRPRVQRAYLACPGPSPYVSEAQQPTGASKPISPPPCNDESRKTQEVHTSCKSLQTAGTLCPAARMARIFRSFAGSAGPPRVSDLDS